MTQFLLLRLYRNGRVLSPHAKVQSGRVRGVLTLRQEHVALYGRALRVARFDVASPRLDTSTEAPTLARLYDADVVEIRPDCLVIAGFETVAVGPLNEPCDTRQAWYCVPAEVDDLIRAEAFVNELATRLAKLGHPVDGGELLRSLGR